ncbi:MAG: hypothetical protein PCFJNLEI_00192 [Verrucomicrobiae bacterium]|nr:hypothetical protein [Verrucomicrobiae bacterium]
MPIKPGINEAVWMGIGSLVLLVIVAVVAYFHVGEDRESKSQRLALVNQIRSSVESAAEAEKSAVLAITDEDSEKFAGQARARLASAAAERQQLERLLLPDEQGLFTNFATAFAELQRIDEEVLALAVKNTNLKAFSLAFGPATVAVKEMDAALTQKTSSAATEARVGAWRLLAALPPHIAEHGDAEMDAMESAMTKEDRQVRRALAEVRDPAATASFEKFSSLRAEIIKLSRENTNVRSLMLSLNEKRKALAACDEALMALQQAVEHEPTPGKPIGRAIYSPRELLLLNPSSNRLH